MTNSVAGPEMRVLSNAEIAMVAGGSLDDLVNPNDMNWLSDDHTFLESNGMIFADYTHDGSFEEAWRPNANCPNGWEQSYTGVMWFCGSDASDELHQWLQSHPNWHVVEG